MTITGLFVTAFIVGFSGALVPGPLLTITIGRSIRQGALAGPLIITGHALLEGAVVAAIIFGLGEFLQRPETARVIAVIGGLVLVWMAGGMVRQWKSAVFTAGEEAAAGSSGAGRASIAAGMGGSLSNPYWFLWWATIGAAFISRSLTLGAFGILAFFVGHILSDYVWYTFVSVSVALGRRVISDRVYQWVLLFCGLFLLFLAVYFIWSGLAGTIKLES